MKTKKEKQPVQINVIRNNFSNIILPETPKYERSKPIETKIDWSKIKLPETPKFEIPKPKREDIPASVFEQINEAMRKYK